MDTGVPIAGLGAPLVSEFALMELIAVLGRTPDGGRMHVGRIIECAWRLPTFYASVIAGRIPPYKAHRIADATRPLTQDAAAFVDRQLAAVANVGWNQLDRLITQAILRFDPERAEAERQKAREHRFCDVSDVDEHGNALITAVVDVADGHDFNQAIAREAEVRGRLGDDSSLDARRAQAVGAIARRDLALDLLTADEDTGEITVRSAGRKVVMDLHITDTTLTGENPVGRWGDKPVTTAQIKQWLRSREPRRQVGRQTRHHRTDQAMAPLPRNHQHHHPPGHQPGGLHPGRLLRDPRPPQTQSQVTTPHLQLPQLHDTRRQVRHRPRDPTSQGRTHLPLQPPP
ncbi:hypothetical protein, partial [Nocardioides sp. Root190]|uniref:hypothetical protein n=1 Tax=Nocardioides sp. Root190 TaxID=1736488 RepID=UPI0039E1A191